MLAIVAACGLSLGRQRQYSLGWDGAVWRLNTGHDEDSPEGRIDVVIDLGGWMLLRWQGRALAAPRWLPVGAGDGGPRWRALRAAAHGQPSEASPAVVDR